MSHENLTPHDPVTDDHSRDGLAVSRWISLSEATSVALEAAVAAIPDSMQAPKRPGRRPSGKTELRSANEHSCAPVFVKNVQTARPDEAGMRT